MGTSVLRVLAMVVVFDSDFDSAAATGGYAGGAMGRCTLSQVLTEADSAGALGWSAQFGLLRLAQLAVARRGVGVEPVLDPVECVCRGIDQDRVVSGVGIPLDRCQRSGDAVRRQQVVGDE